MKSLFRILLIIIAVNTMGFCQTTEEAVKPLLIHGIEVYLQNKYELAIRYFEEVQKLDPKNELAQQYIESSRQKMSEADLQKELDTQNKSLEK
jgi:hypothetical protein